jgi:branched-chain amino acid transport system permease protein
MPPPPRLAAAAALAGLLAIPWVVRDNYYLHLLIVSGIFVLLASGLNLIVGFAGQLSLGHTAFFALGAYTSALLFLKAGLPMWVGLPAGALVATVAALALGAVILRVRGHRFVIISLIFAEILKLVSTNWVELTRGFMGLPGLQVPALWVPGWGRLDLTPKARFYYVALAFALATLWLCRRLAASPVGRAFALVRENEALAEALGLSAYRYCMVAFVAGAALAGAAGSLYAHYVGFVSPDLFNFSYMTIMLIMVIMGGKGTVLGPALGAVIFTFLPELLREAAEFRMPIFAAILIVATLYMPRGIIFPLLERLPRRARRAGRPPHAASA